MEAVYWLADLLVVSLIILPILFLEMGVGQLNQCGIPSLWGKMVPIFQGIK